MTVVLKHSIASALVLALCGIFFIESLSYPVTAARLPQILIVILALLAVLMLVESVVKQRKQNKLDEKKENSSLVSKVQSTKEINDIEKKEPIKVKRVLIFGTMIALYIFLLETLGYFILTPLFTFGALMYLKATNLLTAVILAVGFTAAIYILFSVLLNVPIPLGIFF